MSKFSASVFFTCSLIMLSINSYAALPLAVAGKALPSLAPLVDKVSPAVVNISVSGSQSNQQIFPDLFQFFDKDGQAETPKQPFIGLGSGVIFDSKQGYIITNFHVIENAEEIKVTLKSGHQFDAQVIGQDMHSDIALLQIKTSKKLTQIPLANSNNLRVGDFVIAIGNPFGLGQTVTSGIISALGRSGLNLENLENFIQTDAAINSGNSGGALVNLNGELIGINTAILGPNGGNIGIGFAIPANMVNNLVQQLLQYGEVRRGILGIKGGELTPELAKTFDLESQHGAFIYQVSPYSAAEESGIKAGDVIVSLNGYTIKSFAELRAKIGSLSAGKQISLTLIRDGETLNLTAVLKESSSSKVQAQAIHPSLSGAVLTNTISPDENKGVVVTEVERDSTAERYGLQQGDIIIGINRTRIRNLKELSDLIKTSPEILALNVLRDTRRLYLILNQ
nr:DegQ family serine endoprotease [Psychromonas ossibalaenae]